MQYWVENELTGFIKDTPRGILFQCNIDFFRKKYNHKLMSKFGYIQTLASWINSGYRSKVNNGSGSCKMNCIHVLYNVINTMNVISMQE